MAWIDFCLLQILVSKSTSPLLRKWAIPGWLALSKTLKLDCTIAWSTGVLPSTWIFSLASNFEDIILLGEERGSHYYDFHGLIVLYWKRDLEAIFNLLPKCKNCLYLIYDIHSLNTQGKGNLLSHFWRILLSFLTLEKIYHQWRKSSKS